MPDVSSIHARLASARKDLLDLSCRNRLISTPRGAGRSSRLEIVDELSDEVFRRLVTEQKSMSFLPVETVPDDVQQHFIDQEFADDDSTELADRHVDERLQTRLSSESLQKALLRLYYDARTFEEEQGVNILYLALGFLKWFEDERSSKERYAPLILIPISLRRQLAGARFKIAWTQDDIITNLSLQEKLRSEFGKDLPDLPPVDELIPSAYFSEVADVMAPYNRWQVLTDDIVLWFFSFSKFLMYRDLDPKVWPADRALEGRELVNSLLGGGFRSIPPVCCDTANIDEILQPMDTIHVVDADSSQAIVIEEVRRGSNLVIQGPPGTGKSQTIANLIATAVKDGKKVLFVAEKMAALEVVKRRLDNIGLGDMCLELHSHRANKRAVLEELKRTLALRDRQPNVDGVQQQATKLSDCRDRLNQHVTALHAPLGNSGFSAFTAIGKLVGLRATNVTTARLTLPRSLEWTADQFEQKLELVRDLAHHVSRLGKPSEHPWRGVLAKGVLPSDVTNVLSKLPPIRDALRRLRVAAQVIAQQFNVPIPKTPLELAELAKIAERVVNAPPMNFAALGNSVWSEARQDIDNLVKHGVELLRSRQRLTGVVSDVGWESDVGDTRRNIKAYGHSWLRLFSKKYRKASAEFIGLLVQEPPKAIPQRIEILDDLVRGQNAKKTLITFDGLGRSAFGTEWRGADSNWSALEVVLNWESNMRESLRQPLDFRRMVASIRDLSQLNAAVSEARRYLKPMLQVLRDAIAPFELDLKARFGTDNLASASLESIDVCLDRWMTNPESLKSWVAYVARVEHLNQEGLAELAKRLNSGELGADDAVPQLKFAFYETLLREAYHQYPELASFDGVSHEQLIANYQALDMERLSLARQEVAFAHHQGIPNSDANVGEVGIINREINKKRNHLTIRRLLKDAGNAVQGIKPVFMMSPISVAQYLEPGILGFDLLLIDEASQVEPVDALGAVARAEQIAVVGDDRQLPPTQFFSKMLGEDDVLEDDESAQTGNIESILGLCRAQGMRDAMLRWHYRSRHHSLIAVSNHEFYNDGLFVVPSPHNVSDDLGLRFHYVNDGVFDRGKSKTNRIEASTVADAVIEHARRYPRKSLGVGAFSVAQRDAILDELELRRRHHSEFEPFFATDTSEPFFVKNLESIQGDERDVIFISVGYGRDSSGYPSMNFGPLQNEGGERRLNVLISRAKERCEVFSSILGDDIDLSRARSWGARALKSYLKYAQLGELDVATRVERDFDSDFEREVGAALHSLGYEIHPQVGLAGFFIDLAVVDPENPARYLLGVECDGATYHSSRSARDRDRLRQQVLEDRGWMIHRVWSTDWFNEPKAQLRQIIAAIEAAKVRKASRTVNPDDAVTSRARNDEDPIIKRHEPMADEFSTEELVATPYVESSFSVDTTLHVSQLPIRELARVVSQIVQNEGPIHVEEIARRVSSLWRCKRTGSRIAEAVERALAEASYNGSIEQSGPFYKPAGQMTSPIRDRSCVESANLLKPEYLPPDELRAAVCMLVRVHFGLTVEEVANEVARLLGFRRTSAQLRQVIMDEVGDMVDQQALVSRNGKLYSIRAENGHESESMSAG